TREALSQRLAKLQGVDLGAGAGKQRQLGALEKQRRDLYDQIVAQIGREVKLVAARRGVSVVFGDVVAPAGGIDLTADAQKDIESLHEGKASHWPLWSSSSPAHPKRRRLRPLT